jgi:hypothetical protein
VEIQQINWFLPEPVLVPGDQQDQSSPFRCINFCDHMRIFQEKVGWPFFIQGVGQMTTYR